MSQQMSQRRVYHHHFTVWLGLRGCLVSETYAQQELKVCAHISAWESVTDCTFANWKVTDCTHFSFLGKFYLQWHLQWPCATSYEQVESELEMGVVYADLVDYVKIMMMLRKGVFFLFCFSFICVLKTTFMRKSPKLGVMCFKRFFLCDLARATASFI